MTKYNIPERVPPVVNYVDWRLALTSTSIFTFSSTSLNSCALLISPWARNNLSPYSISCGVLNQRYLADIHLYVIFYPLLEFWIDDSELTSISASSLEFDIGILYLRTFLLCLFSVFCGFQCLIQSITSTSVSGLNTIRGQSPIIRDCDWNQFIHWPQPHRYQTQPIYVMETPLREQSLVRGGHIKSPSKYLRSTFTSSTLPCICDNTIVLAATHPTVASAGIRDDGWFISDFYAFNYLLKDTGKEQTWLTAADPYKLIDKYGPYLHGNPYEERKVCLDRDMLDGNKLTDVTVVRSSEMIDRFISEAKRASELAKRTDAPLLLSDFLSWTPKPSPPPRWRWTKEGSQYSRFESRTWARCTYHPRNYSLLLRRVGNHARA